jgi:hypothetical protein
VSDVLIDQSPSTLVVGSGEQVLRVVETSSSVLADQGTEYLVVVDPGNTAVANLPVEQVLEVIEPGPQGPKGDKGDTGDSGPAGHISADPGNTLSYGNDGGVYAPNDMVWTGINGW